MQITVSRNMAILSLVGRQMRHMVGIAGKMFSTLAEGNVNIEMISQGWGAFSHPSRAQANAVSILGRARSTSAVVSAVLACEPMSKLIIAPLVIDNKDSIKVRS